MASVAEKQPVGTPELRQLALKRWQTFGTVVDTQINNLKYGIAHGYTAPKPAVTRVLSQLYIMIDGPVEQSPFFDFAKRDGDPAFKNQVAALITTIINPSLHRYIDYLEHEYLPQAREQIGASALPSGSKCYQAKIKNETTLTISPKEIHEIGLLTVKKSVMKWLRLAKRNMAHVM